MAEKNQVVETKSDKKSQPKVKLPVVEERIDELANLSKLPGGPMAAAGDGTIEGQAARLGDTRLQTAQRQALAAQIGRGQGNRHLQRVVASLKCNENAVPGQTDSPSASRTAIQRDPDGEFIPMTSARPEYATVKIGDRKVVAYRLVNANEAPRGMTFLWDTVLVGESLEFLGMTDSARGRRTNVSVRALAPGTTDIQTDLTCYQVSGEQGWRATHIVDVTVPTPTILETSLRRESDSGEAIEGDPNRMREGEYLIVRVSLGNVSTRVETEDEGVDIGGEGYGSVLVEEDWGQDGPGVYQIKLRANAIGAANLNIRVVPGRTPQDQAPSTRVSTHVEMDRRDFIDLCGAAGQNINGQARLIQAWVNRVAIRYGEAWRAHMGALGGQDAANKLAGELILAGALGFFIGGTGGVVGHAMRSLGATYGNQFLVNGMVDAVKGTMARGAQGVVPGSDPAFTTMPERPSDWQNEYQARVNEEISTADLLVGYWIEQAVSNPDFKTDFNPVNTMREAMRINGVRPEELEQPDEQIAYLFEKGFWKKWIETYGYYIEERSIAIGVSRYRVQPRAHPLFGRKILGRLRELANLLGENAYEWISEWGGPLRRQLEEEVQQRGFEPPPLPPRPSREIRAGESG